MTDLPEMPEPDVVPDYSLESVAYSREVLRSYGEACRSAGLEEAARLCDKYAELRDDQNFRNCASAIRSAAQKPCQS